MVMVAAVIMWGVGLVVHEWKRKKVNYHFYHIITEVHNPEIKQQASPITWFKQLNQTDAFESFTPVIW